MDEYELDADDRIPRISVGFLRMLDRRDGWTRAYADDDAMHICLKSLIDHRCLEKVGDRYRLTAVGRGYIAVVEIMEL